MYEMTYCTSWYDAIELASKGWIPFGVTLHSVSNAYKFYFYRKV